MNSSDLKNTLSVLNNTGKMFVAFNANIDNIVPIEKNLEKFAKDCKPNKLTALETPKDLFSAMLYSIKTSEPLELVMNKKTEQWIFKNIHPARQRMGGQAGIISNTLTSLKIPVVVYTPLLSKEQKKLFSKGIKFIGKNKKDKKVNWIFEYAKGQTFFGIRAPDVGRFIAASRPDAFRMKDVPLNFDFSCAILSGFQNIQEKYLDGTTYKDQFFFANKLMKKIRAKKKPTHLEFAYSGNKKIMRHILQLASRADSTGMDESELMLALKILKQGKLAKKIHNKHDIRDVYEGVKIISKTGVKKVHIHGAGYFLALCKKDYHLGPEEVKKSMDLAAVVAGAEASWKVKSRNDIVRGLKYSQAVLGWKKQKLLAAYLKKKGLLMKDGIARGEHNVILVPNRTIGNIRDVVGLGDIISATIFATEVGFARRNTLLMKALKD